MTKFAYVLCIPLALAAPALPQQSADFAGIYTVKSVSRSDSLRVMNNAQNLQPGKSTLKISQNAISIEFLYTLASGKTEIRTYRLDGGDSINVEVNGTTTTERAKMKGKALIIKSTKEVPSGPLKGTPLYVTSKWELSRDLKTLTALTEFQIERERVHMVGDTFTTTYVRQ